MASNKKERIAEATQSKPSNNTTTKKPQWQVILDELYDHMDDGITSWDMITRHHITRTAAHIATLRKVGYEILSVNETHDGVTYARYFVIDDDYGADDDTEDEDESDNVDALIEEIWEATGKWVSPAQLEARNRYDAHGEWVNTRGW